MGAELAVGYLFAWAVRKARLVAGRADAEVDEALDAGMDRLHELVVARLGPEPALEHLTEEAASGPGTLTDRTGLRLRLALEDAADRDAAFADALRRAVADLGAISPDGGPPTWVQHVVARDGGSAFGAQGDGSSVIVHYGGDAVYPPRPAGHDPDPGEQR